MDEKQLNVVWPVFITKRSATGPLEKKDNELKRDLPMQDEIKDEFGLNW